jgi:HD-GYP domain-containing protein (c-di-GMP phosphodiesterase class II)
MKTDQSQDRRIVMGERFFAAFFRLVQALRLHQSNNELVIRLAKEFFRATDLFAVNESSLILQITGGRFYLQKEKLRYRKEMVKLVANAIQYFESRKLHGLEFCLPIEAAERNQIFRLGRLLNQAEKQAEPAQWLEDEMENHKLSWVKLMPEPISNKESSDTLPLSLGRLGDGSGSRMESAGEGNRQAAQQGYTHVLSSLQEVTDKVTTEKPAGMRRTIRSVQKMVDLVIDDSFVLLGLSTLRDYDDYTYTHSVNVSILAMCVGHRIGLSRESLEMLGICGLFHDLGKVSIPIEILNKPHKLDGSEIHEIRRHTFHSVRHIVKLQIARDIRAKIMLPPFEHHLKFDLSGYPQTDRRKPMTLFGRILAIADVFDAITSPRVYRKHAMSPDEALGWMAQRSGSDFDPILMKVFINMMGVYPPGTLLMLDSGEFGLVKGHADGNTLDRPRIVLLKRTANGDHVIAGEVDLTERDEATGEYIRNIQKGYHPGEYGIQPAQYIL